MYSNGNSFNGPSAYTASERDAREPPLLWKWLAPVPPR